MSRRFGFGGTRRVAAVAISLVLALVATIGVASADPVPAEQPAETPAETSAETPAADALPPLVPTETPAASADAPAASASGDVSASAMTITYTPSPAIPNGNISVAWTGCGGDGRGTVSLYLRHWVAGVIQYTIGVGGFSPVEVFVDASWAGLTLALQPEFVATVRVDCFFGGGGSTFFFSEPLGGGGPTNHAPVASFGVTRFVPDWNTYRFTSTATDPDAGDSITSQTWEFSDGGTATGATVLHSFSEPGTYTASHRVVDSHGLATVSTQQVVVPAPTLALSVTLPDHPTGRVTPGEEFTARVQVSAGADGFGDLSQVAFDGAVLTADPADRVSVIGGPDPAVPTPMTLAPGTSRSFDVRLRAEGSGAFSLRSQVRAVDAAGRVVGPVGTTTEGATSGLTVVIEAGEVHQDAVDVVMRVRNEGRTPIEGLGYPGGGIAAHPEYVPPSLRGGVTRAAGPTPPLPTRLEAGQEASATFRFEVDEPGTVVVIGEAAAQSGGVTVSDTDVGEIDVAEVGAARRPLTKADLREVLISLVQDELKRLHAQAIAGQEAVSIAMNRVIREARKQGLDLAPKPEGYESGPVLDIDNVRLSAVAVAGLVKGVGRTFTKAYDFAVGTPAQYYAYILDGGDGDFFRPAKDFVEAGLAAKGAADSVAFGVFAKAFNLYNGIGELTTNGYVSAPGGGQYADLLESLADNHAYLERPQAAPPAIEADPAFQQYLSEYEDRILRDPYGSAESFTSMVGEHVIGEELLGEGVVRGGAKLIELATEAHQLAKYGRTGPALKRVTTGETLETLGPREISLADAERLGGFTQEDSTKIQGIIADVKQKFGVDLQIQARPSNVHSVKYLNSAEGALGKPEVFKAKNLNDIDVAYLGADPSAVGKLGVFEPKRPSPKSLARLSPDLQREIRLRYNTQADVWKEWNDPTSKFRKNYALASQEGGHTFEFAVPTAKQFDADGNPIPGNPPRKYPLEVQLSKRGKNNTQTFLGRQKLGDPFVNIVSDIDFHAYMKIADDTVENLTGADRRGEIEQYLQKAWKDSGIAFGDHGATLNGFDWANAGVGANVVARHKFELEFLSKAQAQSRAAELSAQHGIPAEDFLLGFVPGKFVITFKKGSIYTGFGTTF